MPMLFSHKNKMLFIDRSKTLFATHDTINVQITQFTGKSCCRERGRGGKEEESKREKILLLI